MTERCMLNLATWLEQHGVRIDSMNVHNDDLKCSILRRTLTEDEIAFLARYVKLVVDMTYFVHAGSIVNVNLKYRIVEQF